VLYFSFLLSFFFLPSSLPSFLFFPLSFFETGSHYAAQVGLELVV
jgi:hypothetical protein